MGTITKVAETVTRAAAANVRRDDGFCAGATIRARAAGIPVTLMAAYHSVPTGRPTA